MCLGTECVSGLPTYSGGGALYESLRERGTCLGEDRRQHTIACLGLCELIQFESEDTASLTLTLTMPLTQTLTLTLTRRRHSLADAARATVGATGIKCRRDRGGAARVRVVRRR